MATDYAPRLCKGCGLVTYYDTGYCKPCAAKLGTTPDDADHDCYDFAVPYTNSGGALGHGFECGRCGRFLQAG